MTVWFFAWATVAAIAGWSAIHCVQESIARRGEGLLMQIDLALRFALPAIALGVWVVHDYRGPVSWGVGFVAYLQITMLVLESRRDARRRVRAPINASLPQEKVSTD